MGLKEWIVSGFLTIKGHICFIGVFPMQQEGVGGFCTFSAGAQCHKTGQSRELRGLEPLSLQGLRLLETSKPPFPPKKILSSRMEGRRKLL